MENGLMTEKEVGGSLESFVKDRIRPETSRLHILRLLFLKDPELFFNLPIVGLGAGDVPLVLREIEMLSMRFRNICSGQTVDVEGDNSSGKILIRSCDTIFFSGIDAKDVWEFCRDVMHYRFRGLEITGRPCEFAGLVGSWASMEYTNIKQGASLNL